MKSLEEKLSRNVGSSTFNTGAVVVSSGAITETNSSDIKTAVEKIDDLQGALKSVDTDELITRITDSAGTEINPAKEDGNLATVKTNTDPFGSGATPFFDSDGDNTAQVLKAGAGKLYKITVENPNAAKAYLQLFDTAAGSVVVGTTVPVYVIPVFKESATIDDFAGVGLKFSTAITYACTTTATGSSDPTTGLTVSAGYI